MKKIGIVEISHPGAVLCSDVLHEIAEERDSRLQVVTKAVDFERLLVFQREGKWGEVAQMVREVICELHVEGADFTVIPANSTHIAIDEIRQGSALPILSMIDVVVDECHRKGYAKVGLLGVGDTMRHRLFEQELGAVGIEMIVPESMERLNTIIYEELVAGVKKVDSIACVQEMIDALAKQGCEAVILGCTELPTIITEENASLPVVDTTRLLALKAYEHALSE